MIATCNQLLYAYIIAISYYNVNVIKRMSILRLQMNEERKYDPVENYII